MNHLNSDQIQFNKMWVDPCQGPLKFSFISRRLKNLIRKKTKMKQWEVVQISIKGVFDYYDFESVLTSPSKGTVLFCKKILNGELL